MSTQKRELPKWLRDARSHPNRETDCQVFLCADLDELVEMSGYFEATMSAGPGFETKLRTVCREKGIPFSAQMQAACDQHARAFGSLPPTLEEMFAPYGGLDAFLDKYCPLPDKDE